MSEVPQKKLVWNENCQSLIPAFAMRVQRLIKRLKSTRVAAEPASTAEIFATIQALLPTGHENSQHPI